MGFERGKRLGRFWNDAQILDDRLRKHNFVSNGKKERDFEISLGSAFDTMADDGKFNCEVISQHSKKTTVKGVYCFGKKHRPDITFDENGIALELKFVRGSGGSPRSHRRHFYLSHAALLDSGLW